VFIPSPRYSPGRTLFLLDDALLLGVVYACGPVVKGIPLVVEAHSKVSFLKSPYKELSPEETSGVFNKYIFW
jgi:hypothetical protein